MIKDNKGYSLLELIVVLAIIGIFIVSAISGLGYIFGTAVRSCANDVKSAVGSTRINTMGKYETVLNLYQGTDGFYRQEWYKEVDTITGTETWISDEPYKIGKSYLSMEYTTKTGTTGTIDANGIWIGFDRSSGKERDVDSAQPLPPGKVGVAEIFSKVTVDGALTIDIIIVPATGKVYID